MWNSLARTVNEEELFIFQQGGVPWESQFLIILFIILLSIANAEATLIDRGGGLIYDTDLNITWLQDANYARTSGYDIDGNMHWDEAMVWAENLTYGGYDDWRLPITFQPDPNCSTQDTGGSRGFNCRGSEMGHLFYDELNYIISFTGCTFGKDCGLIDLGPFVNIRAEVYWSETKWVPDPINMWFFSASNGWQAAAPFYNNFLAWAVRDGDVSPVPEPASLSLLVLGIAGISVWKRIKLNNIKTLFF